MNISAIMLQRVNNHIVIKILTDNGWREIKAMGDRTSLRCISEFGLRTINKDKYHGE